MEKDLRPVMVQILISLGFLHSRDFNTIVKPNSFELLDDDLIRRAVKDYNLHENLDVTTFLDAEKKFQIVNRILELKHGLIIDEIKEMDGKTEEGYDLEMLPFGF